MGSIRPRLRRPSAPMLVALLALFVALGGPAQAARVINGSAIKRGTLTSKQIKDRSIKVRDLESSAVRTLLSTADDSITAPMLGQNSVTTRALAPGSVLTGTVGDNSLTAADLATNSVGTDEVSDNAIGQSEIRNNGVAASEIADNSIDGGEIVDGGLSIRDVARQVGTLEWPVGTLQVNQCDTDWVPITGIEIAGDFVVISPTSVWPDDLVYTVNGANLESWFKVQACNRPKVGEGARIDGAKYIFNYAVLGY
ncbi:MAG TPA: hypothetical protein VK631_25465 [Solirubrobacteraceae bacterium]|nr:hypothetical protein [Solirubrobacteraceae bacterium]